MPKKFLTPRSWSREEVDTAVEAVLSARSSTWDELNEIDLTTGDYTEADAMKHQWKTLFYLHPHLQFIDISALIGELHKRRTFAKDTNA